MPILLQGVWLTIVVTIGSLLLSTVLGLVWALMRVSGVRILTGLSAALINVIRGIPITTTVHGLRYAVSGLEALREMRRFEVCSLQEYHSGTRPG